VTPVRIAARAARDANEIADFIAQRNPERGESFRRELIERARRTGETPRAHPARDDLSPGLRVTSHGRYPIFFRDLPTHVRIVRIVYSARDLGRIGWS